MNYTTKTFNNSKNYNYNVKKLLNDTITVTKQLSLELENTAISKQKEFIENLIVETKKTDNLHFFRLDYDKIQEKKRVNLINYKNSFIEYAYKTIDNPSFIFTTITLKSEYHPLIFNNFDKMANPKFGIDYERRIYDGFKKIDSFDSSFYANKTFKKNRLTNNKRARVTALEPHKSLVPHFHKAEIIENTEGNNYLFSYIKTFVQEHKKADLGRSEIVIFKKEFKDIKSKLEEKYSITVEKKNIYRLNEHIYIKVLKSSKSKEVKNISNYITKYMEVDTPNTQDSKAVNTANLYNGWARYLGTLKDKFEPKSNGKKHKKVRRVRYSKLLVNKEVYKKIFTGELKEAMLENGDYKSKNMYSQVTNLIQKGDLIVNKIYSLSHKKVMFYNIDYKGKNILINNCKYFTYYEGYNMRTDDLTLLQLHTNPQIDLLEDSYLIEPYGLNKKHKKTVPIIPLDPKKFNRELLFVEPKYPKFWEKDLENRANSSIIDAVCKFSNF